MKLYSNKSDRVTRCHDWQIIHFPIHINSNIANVSSVINKDKFKNIKLLQTMILRNLLITF